MNDFAASFSSSVPLSSKGFRNTERFVSRPSLDDPNCFLSLSCKIVSITETRACRQIFSLIEESSFHVVGKHMMDGAGGCGNVVTSMNYTQVNAA